MPKDQNFFERLRQHTLPVIVDFWAPWCGPCRVISPALEKIGQEYNGRVDIWKVNADEQPNLLRELGIYGIPTLVVFRQGEEVTRKVGAASPEALRPLFEAALTGIKPAPRSISTVERALRLGLGGALILLAYLQHFAGFYLLLALLGAVIAFSAVHDRCPIWQAISPRLKALLAGNKEA